MLHSQDQRMLQGNIASEFVRFVFPSVFGMLAISSASVVDGMFIGTFIGPTALAAVSFVTPLLAIVFGLLIMVSVGGVVAAGKFLGQGDSHQASNIFSKTCVAATLMLCVLGLGVLLMPVPIMQRLGADGAALELGVEYIWIVAWFFPAFAAAVLLSQFVRVDGQPGISFWSMTTITIVNIALDALLVAWLGWGVVGAALATGIAFVFGALVPLRYFLSDKASLQFIKPIGSWFVLFRSSANGISEFLNEASSGLVLLVFNLILMSQIGAMGVASFAAVDYAIYFGILIFYGVSEGVVPLISVNFGGRAPQRIRKFLLFGVGVNMVVGLALIAMFLLIPGQLIGLFIQAEETEARTFSLSIIAIVWPLFLFAGANIAISAYFTGMHCAVQSATIATFRSLVLPILLIYLFWQWFGVLGAFYALPIAEGLTLLLSVILLWAKPPSSVVARSQLPD